MGPLLHSCVEARAVIELSFGVVSGVTPGIHVLEGVQLPHSLDFTFNRLYMKLFKTGSVDVVKDCQYYFAIDLPSCVLKKRQDKFILQYKSTVNNFCKLCINL